MRSDQSWNAITSNAFSIGSSISIKAGREAPHISGINVPASHVRETANHQDCSHQALLTKDLLQRGPPLIYKLRIGR